MKYIFMLVCTLLLLYTRKSVQINLESHQEFWNKRHSIFNLYGRVCVCVCQDDSANTDLLVIEVFCAESYRSDLNQFMPCLLLFCAVELIKKHDLDKDEPRPLYMDFQATTPMVAFMNYVALVTGFNS